MNPGLGGGVLPVIAYMGVGEVGSAQKGYLFMAAGRSKGRNWLVELYEMVRKSVISVGKKAQKG